MVNKPSILIVSSWYPSNDNPTNGSFVHEQVKMLQKNGHEVTVVKPNLSGTFIETWKGKKVNDKNYEFDGVKVFEIGATVYLPKLKAFYYQQLVKKTIKVIERNKIHFDIIHSHALLSAGIISSILSKYFKKSLFHTEHSSELIFASKQFDNAERLAIKELIEQANKVLFVSNYAKENSLVYKDYLSEKIAVLHNVVDPSFFDATISNATKENQILVVGDFSMRKNQLFLLNVWDHILTEYPQFSMQLVFAGNGFDNSSFIEKSKNLKNIVVLPRLNRQEVVEQLAKSKVLVSVSKLETFGLTVAEALAVGTPVVVTDSGGVSDIVCDGDGYIVKEDVEEFSKCLLDVLNGNHDTPEIIRKRCLKRFSEQVIYDYLNKIYSC